MHRFKNAMHKIVKYKFFYDINSILFNNRGHDILVMKHMMEQIEYKRGKVTSLLISALRIKMFLVSHLMTVKSEVDVS